MTTLASSTLTDWATRAAALADELSTAGKLTSPSWRAAVEAVPRHVLVPSFYVRRDGRMIAVTADDNATRAEWLEQVYANTALVTKIGQEEPGEPPVFLSSSSTPGLMTRMLEALDLRNGQKVLEIGTGTGYNAALLSHRLGDQRVFSIDVEPDLVDAARIRLADLGYHPTLVTGDGGRGLPEHAPFDRIIATCAVPAIPWPWIDQTTVGGVILTDIKVGLAAGNLVRLTRVTADRAEGMFDAGQAAFMELRHTPGTAGRIPYARAPQDIPQSDRPEELFTGAGRPVRDVGQHGGRVVEAQPVQRLAAGQQPRTGRDGIAHLLIDDLHRVARGQRARTRSSSMMPSTADAGTSSVWNTPPANPARRSTSSIASVARSG